VTAVGITPRSFRQTPGEHVELLERSGLDVRYPDEDRPLDERELLKLVRGCAGLIVGVEPVTDGVLAAGPLRAVVKYGSGMDNIDLEAARRRAVTVSSTPGANARSVGELTIGLLLALARHLPLHDRLVRAGSWSRLVGTELGGKRLGILGYGAVGREVAVIARGLDMDVIAHDPFVVEADVELVNLPALLASSDAVSLHVPLDEKTRNVIDANALALMRPGALLVNTARGGLVDEHALAEALASGRLGGAALDTFTEEPPQGSPLLSADNVILSPHAGAATVEAARRAGTQAVRALLDAL
jgi:D-3-phosphoglycerate dehydrogenase / 2-oxoglutarate reductase